MVVLGGNARLAQAQDEKAKEASPPAAAAAESTASAPAAGSAAATPALPPYMTGQSPDPSKPLFPDATGANAGYWTTPSPPPAGDGDPAAQPPAGLYDRIVH